jgi:thiamine biosynthesis lipoprotein
VTTRLAVEPAVAEWPVWTTTARLLVTDPAVLLEASAAVIEHLARVDAAASRFQPGSEVSRIAAGSGAAVRVSPLLAELVGVALAVAAATGGAVDPTLGGPLRDLGYTGDGGLPDPAGPPVSVRRRVSWRDVRLDGPLLTIPAGTLLDLGATAKAHAADHCATTLADRFGCGVLVSLGGDLRAAGPPPQGGWQVLVQDGPDEPASQVRLVGAEAVTTSSTLHRTWSHGGQVLHHVLDPATCRPAPPVWRTASVADRSCVRANAWSTAALVRGHDAQRMLRVAGVAARLVAADGVVLRFGGWPA